ncbi:MAG: hypothetical protein ABIG60_04430 [Patescibacteria group bacterium]
MSKTNGRNGRNRGASGAVMEKCRECGRAPCEECNGYISEVCKKGRCIDAHIKKIQRIRPNCFLNKDYSAIKRPAEVKRCLSRLKTKLRNYITQHRINEDDYIDVIADLIEHLILFARKHGQAKAVHHLEVVSDALVLKRVPSDQQNIIIRKLEEKFTPPASIAA